MPTGGLLWITWLFIKEEVRAYKYYRSNHTQSFITAVKYLLLYPLTGHHISVVWFFKRLCLGCWADSDMGGLWNMMRSLYTVSSEDFLWKHQSGRVQTCVSFIYTCFTFRIALGVGTCSQPGEIAVGLPVILTSKTNKYISWLPSTSNTSIITSNTIQCFLMKRIDVEVRLLAVTIVEMKKASTAFLKPTHASVWRTSARDSNRWVLMQMKKIWW